MNRDELDRQLALYATGGLTSAEKQQLFAAALQDQELFDALMAEDALRELIELPGARPRLIAALEPRPARQQPLWLAWASGLAVVFLSGGLTYWVLQSETDVSKQVANAVFPSNKPAPKPFTPPVAASARRDASAQPPMAEPPPLVASKGPSLPPVANPVMALPPPPPAKASAVLVAEVRAERETDTKVRDQVELAKESSKDAKSVAAPFRAAQNQVQRPTPSASQAGGGVAQGVVGGVIGGVPAAAPMAPATVAAKRKVAEAVVISIWRATADGVWTRFNPGEAVDRNTAIAIRVVAPDTNPVVLLGANGRPMQTLTAAAAGDELEFRLPAATLRGARGNALALTVRGATVTVMLR